MPPRPLQEFINELLHLTVEDDLRQTGAINELDDKTGRVWAVSGNDESLRDPSYDAWAIASSTGCAHSDSEKTYTLPLFWHATHIMHHADDDFRQTKLTLLDNQYVVAEFDVVKMLT